MIKSLLESTLERFLSENGMGFHERLYTEDQDFQGRAHDVIAEIEDEPAPSGLRSLGSVLGVYSPEQENLGNHPFIERKSTLYNGMGFRYSIYAETGEPSKDCADRIISTREFGISPKGTRGSEVLSVDYNNDDKWKRVIPSDPHYAQLERRFYVAAYPILTLDIFPDNEINVEIRELIDDRNVTKLFEILRQVEERFNGRVFDEDAARELTGYLTRIKEAA